MLLFNGQLFNESDESFQFYNRSFLYGESVFTTMRVVEGTFLFLEEHLRRLRKGVEYVFDADNVCLDNLIGRIWSELGVIHLDPTKDYRIRITIFSESDERQFVLNDVKLNYLISYSEIPQDFCQSRLDAVSFYKGSGSPRAGLPSFVKSGNYLISIKALRDASQRGFKDIIFVDGQGRISEASTSNIFFRIKNHIYTPAINSSILDGITRTHFIHCLEQGGIDVIKGNFAVKDLMNAEEIWLTNSIRGIVSVGRLEGKALFRLESKHSWTQRLSEEFMAYCKKHGVKR